MISVLEKQRDEEISLVSWIKNNGTGVYCVAGDAGTGKSTFLHHLEYKFKEYSWEFLDLQKSVYDIKIMEFNVEFKQFSTLRNKLLSSIINQMIELIRNTIMLIQRKELRNCFLIIMQIVQNYIQTLK